MPVSEELREGSQNSFNFKQKYKNLKRKFRYLIYENECFQEELKRAHRRLLKVNQDKSFLLDRLLQYEKVDDTSSDSDGTISSDSELDNFSAKRKRSSTSNVSNSHGFASTSTNPTNASRSTTSEASAKRKKPASKSTKSSTSTASVASTVANVSVSSISTSTSNGNVSAVVTPPVVVAPVIKVEPEDPVPLSQGDGHMTSEEIERHLESRRTLLDLVPERAPPTVPTEMFSTDLSCIDKLLADD